MTEEKLVLIIPSARQLIHSKQAQFITETKACDMYHLMEAVQILRSIVGDQPLKNHYKHKYKPVMKHLKKLSIQLTKIKIIYDSITKWDEEKKQKKLKEFFKNEHSQIPIINKHLFKCHDLLLNKTNLKFTEINNDYIKKMRLGDKKLDTKPIKPEEQPKK